MATTAIAASSPYLKGKAPATASASSSSGSSNPANLSAAEKASERTKLLFAQRALPFPDFASYKPAKELKAAHRGAVRSLGWSCDGNWLATCGDESIRIWAPERSTDVRGARELKGHTRLVQQVAWNPRDPHLLASAAADRTVRIWDTRDQAGASSSSASSSSSSLSIDMPAGLLNLAYHPGGNYLAVGDRDDRIWLIDARNGKRAALILEKGSTSEEYNELQWTPDGRKLVVSSNQSTLDVLDCSSFTGAAASPTSAEEAAGEEKATEGESASASTSTVPIGWPKQRVLTAHTATVFCVKCDPTMRFVASAGVDSMVALWDVNEWTSHGMYAGLTANIRALDFSHDGELLAVGGEDPNIEILATSTMTAVHKIPYLPEYVNLAWHPSRYVLAYGGDKGGSAHVFGI